METYDDQALMQWAEILRELGTATEAIYVFFKHEASAPDLAMRLAPDGRAGRLTRAYRTHG